MDEKGKAMERALNVLEYADYTGLGTFVRGAQTGDRSRMIFGGIGMVTHVTGVFSSIGKDVALSGLAKEAGSSVQGSLDRLAGQLARGNLNPGIGTKNLFGNVFYARGRDGARVFFRRAGDKIEILAKASKQNEAQVINRLKKLYE